MTKGEMKKQLISCGYKEIDVVLELFTPCTFGEVKNSCGNFLYVICDKELIFAFGRDKATGCNASICIDGEQTDTSVLGEEYIKLCLGYASGEISRELLRRRFRL